MAANEREQKKIDLAEEQPAVVLCGDGQLKELASLTKSEESFQLSIKSFEGWLFMEKRSAREIDPEVEKTGNRPSKYKLFVERVCFTFWQIVPTMG